MATLSKKIGFYTVKMGFSESGNGLVVVSFLEEDNYIYSKTYKSENKAKSHFEEIVASISYHHKNRYPWVYKTLRPKFYLALITETKGSESLEQAVFCYTGKGNEMLHGNQGVIVGSLFLKGSADRCCGIPAYSKDGGISIYKKMLKAFNLKKKG